MQRARHNRLRSGKLPAFTILELTVVMFLTGVVMASAYLAWTIVAQQFLGYQTRSNRVGELARIEVALHRDMEKAAHVTRTGDAITFYHPASTNIEYQFEANRIIRIAAQHADTIDATVDAIETRTLNLPRTGQVLVEQLDITLTPYGRTQKMRFKKEYGVAIKMLADSKSNNES